MLPPLTSLIRRCTPLVPLLLAPALSAQDVFWTERATIDGVENVPVIKGADIDGQNVVDVFVGTEMASFIVDLEVTDTHLYWSGHSGGDVWRQTIGGSDAGRIVEQTAGLSNIHGLAVDAAAGRIYIANHGTHLTNDPGGVFSTNLDGGSGIQSLWTSGTPQFYTGISLGGPNEVLWFTRASEYLYIQSTSGGMPSFVELENSGEIYGLTYNPDTNIVYYTNISGSLNFVNLTTQEQGTLYTPGITAPLGLKLSPARTHLIIAERGRGISAYQLATGGYELIVNAPGAHFGAVSTADPGDLEVPPPPPPPAEDGDILFFADFEEDVVDALPVQNWTSAPAPTEGTALVAQDSETYFGGSEENKFLRVESARSLNIQAEFEPAEIVTLSYDYIGRINEVDGSRALNLNLRSIPGNNNYRVHVIQMNPISGLIDTVSFGMNNLVYRFDLVVNKSLSALEYNKPDGSGTASLDAGLSALWRYDYAGETWTLLRDAYSNVRGGSTSLGDKMMSFHIQLDSGSAAGLERRSFDMDNIHIYKGAVPGMNIRETDVSYPPIPYPEEPVLVVHEDFELYDGPRQITALSDYLGTFDTGQLDMTRMPTAGTVSIVQDTENRFGRGADNLVMYWDKAVSANFDIPIGGLNTGVATVAFDMYHEGQFETAVTSATNRLGARFYVNSLSSTNNIVNNFGLEADLTQGTYFVRGITAAGRRVHPNYLQRWVVVRNNTRDTISYDSPRGQIELSAGFTHVWLNGFLFNAEYGYGDNAGAEEQVITGFRFDAFNSWTAYIDNIRVWEGAIVPEAHVERETEPAERDLLVYDGFDYSEGSLDGQNGGIGWAGGYITSEGFPSAEVVSPGLAWPWLADSGNAVRAAGPTPDSDNSAGTRNFRVIDIDGIHSSMLNKYSPTHIGPQGGSVWLSVVGQGNPDQTGTFWGLSLYRDTSEQSGEVLFLGKGSPDTEGWRFAGGGGSTTGGVVSTGKPLTNKHFWVIRIDYNDDGNQVAHLFHNPTPNGAEPTEPTLSRETRIGSFGFDRIRIAGNGAGFMIDEIRIGTSWEAVAPLGDEPPPAEGFAGWLELHFPGASDPATIGADADPDGDGVPNLLEFALGMDPNESSREGLPVLGTIEIEGALYLTLTGRLPDGTNLDLAVEATSDVGDWSNPDLGVPVSGTPNGDGTTTYTFRDVEPIDGNGRRFMRLSVAEKTD